MEIITVVEGKVPISKAKIFEESFAAISKESIPHGLIRSSLLKNIDDPEVYQIETIWLNKEVLENMKSSKEGPLAPKLFKEVGATPLLKIFELKHKMP